MTCIVAVAHKCKSHGGIVWMGGDACGSRGTERSIRSESKVFVRGPMVLGYTSSFRMGQLLQYRLDIPEHHPRISDMGYMSMIFMDAVRECFKQGGFTTWHDGGEHGGEFLVGYRGRIYCVQSDFQVGSRREGFDAVGSGSPVALGALHATHRNIMGVPPKNRVRYALEAAAHHDTGVAGPFKIIAGGEA